MNNPTRRAPSTAPNPLESITFPTPETPLERKRRRTFRKHEWYDRDWDGPAVAKLAFYTLLPLVPFALLILLAAMAG